MEEDLCHPRDHYERVRAWRDGQAAVNPVFPVDQYPSRLRYRIILANILINERHRQLQERGSPARQAACRLRWTVAAAGLISPGRMLHCRQMPTPSARANLRAQVAYSASSGARKEEVTAPSRRKGECWAKREQDKSLDRRHSWSWEELERRTGRGDGSIPEEFSKTQRNRRTTPTRRRTVKGLKR